MSDLIERLEKATGPDRRLDEAIALANGWYQDDGGYGHHHEWFPPKGVTWHEPPFAGSHSLGGYTAPPRYTGSIDAALRLVPEALSCAIRVYPDGRGACEIWRYVTETFAKAYGGAEELRRRNGTFNHQNVAGATPAIALCIAALKARSQAAPIPAHERTGK